MSYGVGHDDVVLHGNLDEFKFVAFYTNSQFELRPNCLTSCRVNVFRTKASKIRNHLLEFFARKNNQITVFMML
ncbi:hypothetical protein KUTeg_009685 [Tegillarca granosa]|uniref:Uncharacterized protein n=1 Tax=Tegillarca granosa TaxID=220873 RepID=A0ABQ9F8W1_TEGGR|nr:hypothetical protein KUTeg_009685 [Tegillarca granosa]